MEFACPVSVYLPPPLPRKAPQLCSENCSNSLIPSGVKSWWDCSSRRSPWGWVSGALFWEGEPWAQRPRLGRAETGRDQGWLSTCTFSLGPQSCSFLTPSLSTHLLSQSPFVSKMQGIQDNTIAQWATNSFVKKRPKMAKSYGTLHFFTYWINHSFNPLPKHQSISPH